MAANNSNNGKIFCRIKSSWMDKDFTKIVYKEAKSFTKQLHCKGCKYAKECYVEQPVA